MTIRSELITYSNAIISGEIITCRKHRWACERFLRDLRFENTEAFPYVFIDDKAERFFNWMRLFKHRKGVLKGKQIEPHIIQKFIFGNIYGWYHKDTGYRRFKKFYWQVARKNAKSQSLACVGSYETLALDSTGTEVNEVYCAATKSEQAKIVFEETVAMLDACKMFAGKYTVAYGRIRHKKTGSIMRALSEEDRKTGDGLNVQCGIIDEYHAHDTSEIYDVIDSGMGARAQPLLAIITTAGFNLTNPCYRVEYDLVSKILNPDIQVNIESYFVMVNELDKNDTGEDIEIDGRKVAPGELVDNIKDEKTWEKANPIICSYPEGRDYLRKKLQEALEAPEKMRNFLTKHMDIWVNQRENGYMNVQKWAACGSGALQDGDFSGQNVYVGLDLSAKIDLTSVGFEIKLDEKYYVFSHSFMPEATLRVKEKTDKVPYALWVRDGWITLTPGEVVDYRMVIAYAKERVAAAGWRVAEWCFDPWGATQVSSDLIEEGETVVEIIQGIKTLSEPTKDFREMVYQGRVVHENNPVLSWAISNAVADEIDRNKNIILNKKKSKERIDPIAAIINCHVRCMVGTVPGGGRVFFA